MRRIGFISTLTYLPWGGSEDLWSEAAARLAGEHLVFANVQKWDTLSPHIIRLMEKGVKVHLRTHHSSFIKRILNRFVKPLDPAGMYYHWFDQVKPDYVVISSGSYPESLEWMEQCSKRNIPYEIVIHVADHSFWQPDEITDKLIHYFTRAERVSFVSKANQELTQKQLAAELSNTGVVWNPIKNLLDEAIPFPEATRPVFAYVGRIEPFHKGLDLLFDVLATEKWRKREADFIIYGDGIYQRTMMRLAESMDLKNVSFMGFRKMNEIWQGSHILVLPSRMEGLPLVIQEAMLAGRAVVTTAVGGNQEVIEDGVTGFIAAHATADDLDRALEQAWEQRSEWKVMGEKGRAHLLKRLPADPVGLFCNEVLKRIDKCLPGK